MNNRSIPACEHLVEFALRLLRIIGLGLASKQGSYVNWPIFLHAFYTVLTRPALPPILKVRFQVSIQYNVSTLLTEPVGSTREFDVDGRMLVDEKASRHERISGHASFLHTKDGVLVLARLRSVQRDQCSRCLEGLDLPLELEIEEEFFTTPDPTADVESPAPKDPDAFLIDSRNILDIGDAVRQYWAGALSMQPLCRPDCKGLCPRCGRDLNQDACACPPERDERWSALRELVVQEREGS